MITLQQWYLQDASKKDLKWANDIITYLRIYLRPLVDQRKAYRGMQTLLGVYDMEFTRKMFKTPENAGVTFIPMAVLEKIRNIIISEIEAAGAHVELKAVDPGANSQRKEDRNLLANRKLIESIMTGIRGEINLPPYSLKDEKQLSGKEAYSGNAEEFDQMGLQDNNDEDLDFFFKVHHRLRHEISAEDAINYFLQFNETNENLALWVDDIMSKKAICQKAYVNDETGAIEYRYLAPETVKTIAGRRRDYKDAPAMNYEQAVTVSEFFKMMGSEFNMEDPRDRQDLMEAVNTANNLELTGIHTDGTCYGPTHGTLLYDQFLNFKVNVGYVEWKSIDSTNLKVTEKNFHGNSRMREKAWGTKESENSIYKRTSRHNEVTYKAYYLAMTPSSQRLFKYGKLSWQGIEGAEDEYSNFSIMIYKEVGKTISEIAWNYIVIIEKAFKKMEHIIMKALPPGFDYNYESLLEIAKKMFPSNNQMTSMDSLMNFLEGSPNKLHTILRVGGQPAGMGGQVNVPLENGIGKAFADFLNVVNWSFNQLNNEIGISPLRNAYTPQERDVYKLQEAALESSDKATKYLPTMINKLVQNTAVRTLLFIQDIIQFKDKNSIPYKFLVQALGYETLEDLESLGKVAHHRYGIFVHGYDSYQEMIEMKRIIAQSYANKEITPDQYLLINSYKSPKKAAMVLAYEKRRNERVQAEQQQQQIQAQMAANAQSNEAQMAQIQAKGQMDLQKVDLQGQWDYRVEELRQQGGMAKQQAKIDNEPEKQAIRTENKIQEKVADANLEAQKPLGSE